MKYQVCLFAAALFASTFAHATPHTMDFDCEDKSGNRVAWDVQNQDLIGSVQHIHTDLYLTIEGVNYELPTDGALASPEQPLLLLQGEDSQYVIIKPVGRIHRKDGEVEGVADVELMIKGSKGPFKKKMRMNCHAFNDA